MICTTWHDPCVMHHRQWAHSCTIEPGSHSEAQTRPENTQQTSVSNHLPTTTILFRTNLIVSLYVFKSGYKW